MVRTRTAIYAAIPIYVLLVAGIAAVLIVYLTGDDKPAPRAPIAQSGPTAPAPVSYTKDTPQYEQLLSCLYGAGYGKSDVQGGRLRMTGEDVPPLTFTVETAAGATRLSPATAADITVLREAGCGG